MRTGQIYIYIGKEKEKKESQKRRKKRGVFGMIWVCKSHLLVKLFVLVEWGRLGYGNKGTVPCTMHHAFFFSCSSKGTAPTES